MLYLEELEEKLEKKNKKTLRFSGQTTSKFKRSNSHCQFLMYADDIVLMANNDIELQSLMNISGADGRRLGLKFSSDKSAVMVFTDDEIAELRTQGFEADRVDKYIYLGV